MTAMCLHSMINTLGSLLMANSVIANSGKQFQIFQAVFCPSQELTGRVQTVRAWNSGRALLVSGPNFYFQLMDWNIL